MESYYFLIWIGLLYFGWSTVTRAYLISFPLAMVTFLPIVSLSTLSEIWLGIDSNLLLFVISPIVALIGLFFGRRELDARGTLLSIVGSLVISSVGIASVVFSRIYGLSSIGFTDGHTILLRGTEFSIGEPAIEEGVKALKRGFAISALHAQGSPTEYLVGFMPLVFLGAVVATGIFVNELSGSWRFALLTSISLIALSPVVEAIGRQIWLINSHTYLWLIFALLGFLVLRFRISERLEIHQVAASYILVSALGFLRVDALLTALPFTIVLTLMIFRLSSRGWYWIFPIQGLSAFLWIVTVTTDFPLFGSIGPYLFLVVGSALPILAFRSAYFRAGFLNAYQGKLYWYLLALFAVYAVLAINLEDSFWALINNLFLGEAGWGALPYLVSAIFLVYIFLGSKTVSVAHKELFRIFVLSILFFVIFKSWDSFDEGSLYSNVARIGFGDSLNRNIISWTPMIFIPIASLAEKWNRSRQ